MAHLDLVVVVILPMTLLLVHIHLVRNFMVCLLIHILDLRVLGGAVLTSELQAKSDVLALLGCLGLHQNLLKIACLNSRLRLEIMEPLNIEELS